MNETPKKVTFKNLKEKQQLREMIVEQVSTPPKTILLN